MKEIEQYVREWYDGNPPNNPTDISYNPSFKREGKCIRDDIRACCWNDKVYLEYPYNVTLQQYLAIEVLIAHELFHVFNFNALDYQPLEFRETLSTVLGYEIIKESGKTTFTQELAFWKELKNKIGWWGNIVDILGNPWSYDFSDVISCKYYKTFEETMKLGGFDFLKALANWYDPDKSKLVAARYVSQKMMKLFDSLCIHQNSMIIESIRNFQFGEHSIDTFFEQLEF